MMEAYKKFWQNYATFSGRSRRSDYWYVVLANMILGAVTSIVTMVLPFLEFLTFVYALATLIPGIALVVRRLHDINKSGWYCLFVLIPLVGAILLLVWLATDSQAGANQYGENPKGIQA